MKPHIDAIMKFILKLDFTQIPVESATSWVDRVMRAAEKARS